MQIDLAVRLVGLGDRHLEDVADDLIRLVDRLREPLGERVVRRPEAVGAARDCRDELREEHCEDREQQPGETTPHVPQHRRPPSHQCEERDNACPPKARGWESGKPLYAPGGESSMRDRVLERRGTERPTLGRATRAAKRKDCESALDSTHER